LNQIPQPMIFDRALLRQRRARSVARFDQHNFLHQLAAEALLERRADMRAALPRVLELGCADGFLAQQLQSYQLQNHPSQGGQVIAADMSHDFVTALSVPSVVMDEEFLPFAAQSFDLIISNLGLHMVNDLPGVLLQCRHALAAEGVLLASMLGGRSLQELRHCLYLAEQEILGGISPRVAPNIALDSAAGLLQRAGFVLPVVDSDVMTVVYPHVFALMHELRALGWNNNLLERTRQITPRQLFNRLAELYAEHYPAEQGGVTATFEIIYLHGWTS
jgi:NADH dehydrogenase [ubiquinone] 1 alpha subcomplex assembly factor 5